jgi:putative toxin-antitoxin system antitoxin component (TIGR02293 family)
LVRITERGLPVEALDFVSHGLADGELSVLEIKYSVVPRSTLRRRTRLSPEESARTERLARLAALAEHVWEDADYAREFLTQPQPQLGGERPIDLARSELGAREVEMLLMKIEHALPV